MRNWNVEDKVLPGIHVRVKHKDPYMRSHLYLVSAPEEIYWRFVDCNRKLLKTSDGFYLVVKKVR